MIKNKKKFQRFEDNITRNSKVDVEKNFQLLEAMYQEALIFGVFPLKNPLSGIETDIKIAKVVNSVSETSRKNRSGTP